MERLKGYYKNVIAFAFAFMFITTGIFSTSFVSKAADGSGDYYLNYPEPATGEQQGYLTLLLKQNSNSTYHISTFFWNTYTSTSGQEGNSYAIINITADQLTFNVGASPNSSTKAYYNLFEITVYPRYVMRKQSTSESYTYSFANAGYTVIGWKCSGNGEVSGLYNTVKFNAYYATDGSSQILSDVLEQMVELYDVNVLMHEYLRISKAHLEQIDGDASDILDELIDILDENVSTNEKLEALKDLERQLIEEQKKSNTWLGKIWDSIQEFINPNSSDKNKTDNYISESNTQKNEIDDLNNQNQVEKVDVNSAAAQVDSNINYDNMAEYGGVLATITNNQYILQLILVVVSVVIISYVLFGKR